MKTIKTWKDKFNDNTVRLLLLDDLNLFEYGLNYYDMLNKDYVEKAFVLIEKIKEKEGIRIPLLVFRETYCIFSVEYLDCDCPPELIYLDAYIESLQKQVNDCYKRYYENENMV